MNTAFGARAAEVLRRYADDGATLSLGSVNRLFPIAVELQGVESATGFLVLTTRSSSEELDHFLLGERLALDAEVPVANGLAYCFSIDDVECDWRHRQGEGCEIRCQVVGWAPDITRSGGIRVPFIRGMSAAVTLEIGGDIEGRAGTEVKGVLLDISAGGCRVQVPVRDGTVFEPGANLSAITLSFPGGEVWRAPAQVRHLRPLGGLYYLALGLQFMELDTRAAQRLRYLLNETERELIWRLGIHSRGSRPSELFHHGGSAITAVEPEPRSISMPSRDAFMQGVQDIGRKLYTLAICLRSERWFPADLLDSAAEDLLVLLESDRARLLYALGGLQNEPRWMRHSIEVAAVLGDVMFSDGMLDGGRPDHAEWREHVLEAIAGALLHALGKTLLQGPALPTLDRPLNDAQRRLLRSHVARLLSALQRVGWEPAPVTLDVIANINERLDGSGYPVGKSGAQLSPLVRMASVAKMANKLLHPQTPLSAQSGATQRALVPSDVWRCLYQQPDQFDRDAVVRLAQRQGPYPIGSLAKFSYGFLAWVRAQDKRGMPAQVQVVRNLAFPDTTLSTMLSGPDLHQLGELEGVVNATHYLVSFPEVS